ncbi:hypothetical protein PORCRE_121 [Porphyromonas crevioricanis JCM 15906]|uniref:N-acetyltransferase domain-containing protein n=1 Tax=Porphyromonas crevioricanis JCM 15906 TaxID=1305617 RepID=S4NFT3_9PORP|nr:GNAT family N-acetyltransferase [Porphyromonas crevioricanis]GAD04437.1 hypothetical protein PORCRE_121 [Porphyromonas crevioricanis JCM 15906]SJZ76059.1 Predicted DNA alkylation repair enzyme [Porphyromonas crevioricanis]
MLYQSRYQQHRIFANTPFRLTVKTPSGQEGGYIEVVCIADNFLKVLHTVVDPKHRGGGLGRELVDLAVRYAAEHRLKLLSACNYAAMLIQRNASQRALSASAEDIADYLRPMRQPEEKKYFVERVLGIKPGEYGFGDQVLPLTLPQLRKSEQILGPFSESLISELLSHPIHDLRLIAVIGLTGMYRKSKLPEERELLHQTYVQHFPGINNWDLVDLSAPYLIGDYAHKKGQDYTEIYSLSANSNLWIKRIGIVSTLGLIRQGIIAPTLHVVQENLSHPHHLIHKAMGWALREVGKKDVDQMISFIEQWGSFMPRTTLRYAIERLDQPTRKRLLSLR